MKVKENQYLTELQVPPPNNRIRIEGGRIMQWLNKQYLGKEITEWDEEVPDDLIEAHYQMAKWSTIRILVTVDKEGKKSYELLK
jgi:hypothetical protein